jgi:hypothetical protein
MDLKTAKYVEKFGDCDVREEYSGRCMYGETTAAVVFEYPDSATRTFLDAAFEAGVQDDYDVVRDLKRLRTDSMGKGVVYY